MKGGVLLRSHGNNGYANTPKFYVIRTLPVWLWWLSLVRTVLQIPLGSLILNTSAVSVCCIPENNATRSALRVRTLPGTSLRHGVTLAYV